MVSLCWKGPKRHKFVTWIEGLEMWLEDVPQFVLTAMIGYSRPRNPFNTLTLIEVDDDDEHKKENRAKQEYWQSCLWTSIS